MRERESRYGLMRRGPRRVDTRAEREHTFYRRVWRANWLPFALSKAPNSHTNTLLRTNIEGRSARCCAASARQRTLTHPASLSSPLDPHSVTATRMFRTPQNPLHPATHLHPFQSQPTKALSFNPLLSRTRTSSGGAYVQAKWSTHSLLHFTTPPFTPSYPPNPTR